MTFFRNEHPKQATLDFFIIPPNNKKLHYVVPHNKVCEIDKSIEYVVAKRRLPLKKVTDKTTIKPEDEVEAKVVPYTTKKLPIGVELVGKNRRRQPATIPDDVEVIEEESDQSEEEDADLNTQVQDAIKKVKDQG